MKKLTMLLTIVLSIFIAAPSVVFAHDYVLSIDNPTAVEGQLATFTVMLNQATYDGDIVLVDYATSGGTATESTDYTGVSGTLTFNATDTQTFQVQSSVDSIVEQDENFTVILSNERYSAGSGTLSYQGGVNIGTGEITDNDTAIFTINDQTVNETAGTMTLTVSLDNPLDIAVNVDVTYGGGTATGGSTDYDSAADQVTFASGDTADKTVTVTINNDNLVEATETFTANLGTATVLGTRSTDFSDTGMGTITDDDSATVSIAATDATAAEPGDDGQFTVSISNQSDTDTVISYTVGGDATGGGDYTALSGSVTIPANTNSATVDVSVMNDSLVEDDETVIVTLTVISTGDPQITIGAANSDTVTISDDDSATFTINDQTMNEGAGAMTLTVSLDNPLDIAVDVDLTYGGETATGGGTDYDSAADQVTFAAGDTADKTVTVAITNDILVEATETFTAGLGTATALGTRSTDFSDIGTGTITDNDTALVSIGANDAAAAEPADDGQFTVTMTNQSDTDTVISYNVTGNATPGSDYIALTGSVTISANATTATIDVDVSDDILVEGNETVTVTLTGITSGDADISIDGANNSDTVTIADDGDTYDVSITNVAPDPAREGIDPTITFTVELSNVDVNGVIGTVNISYATADGTADGSDYTSTSGTLAFTSGTGPTLTVDVLILNDDLMESDETFDFTLSAFTGGGSINGTNPETGTINDDTDKCGISIDGPYTVTEGSSITFTVNINQVVPSGETVTVQYKTTDDTAVAEGDYGAISLSTLTFDAGDGPGDGQAIIVNTNDDSLYEFEEHFYVDLSSPSANAAIIDGQGDGYIDIDADKYDVSIEAAETVTEGTEATVTFTVTLDQEVPGGTSVSFTLDDVTAVVGSDYSENTPVPTLNFAADETTKDVVVNIINDDLYEVPETFEVNITCADPNSTISIGNDKGTCTINDDGIDKYNLSITAVPVPDPVLEADTTVTFTVTLDQEVPGGATVDFSLNDVTATLGSDYSQSTANPLSFAAGETTKDIIVNIINDQVDENSEAFEVIITNADLNAILVNDTGTCTITDNDYTVTFNIATVGPVGIDGGTVNTVLSLDQVVDHGTDCAPVTATPNAGYRFVEWTGDYNGTANPLTITNVTSDMTITANFIAIYTITASAGANGTISPSGAVIVDYGTDQTFIFDPDTCYEVDDVVVDGSSIGGEIRNYTFTNVTADHGIDVQFYHYDCTITATAEHGGTITPSGAVTVPCGSNQSFTISAGMDNEIAEVLVDGVDLGIGGPGVTTDTYNWTNVKKDDDDTSPCVHYIVAKFTRPALSCMDISDTPLNAMSRSAPANIMFVLDDSGSMDWEFITDESDGLFNHRYYVFNNPGDNLYSNTQILSGADRLRWKSQWSGYNRMYYDPNVDYSPWPNRSGANPDFPQSHPMHAGNTLDLSGIYESFDDGIVIDNVDGAPTFTTPTGNWSESGASPEYNGSSYYSNDAGATATWAPNLPTAGNYEVWIYWASSSGWDRDASAQYTIHDTIGDHVFVRDQRVNYGQWNLMGTFSFAAGSSGYVTLTRGSGGATSADAVKFVSTSGGGSISIRNAHYYVWSATESKPYLVVIDGGSIEYYEVNDDGDDLVETGELTLTASPPADVVTGRNYAEERQNFANWYSFYRKRELTATAAIANVINSMQGVQIGLRGINGYDSDIIQPVHKIKVGGVDETSTLLNKLYNFDNQAYGTPLRRGLEAVGRYFHQYDGQDGGIGTSPYATAADGGECQQAFAIVMTDGYWNGGAPLTGAIANNDGDGSSAYDGAAPHGDEPYGDTYFDTLADVAMYYYENDLSTTLGPEVPENPWDDNQQQHLVTYGVSFGVTGTLDPSAYDFMTTFPTWPNPTSGDQQKIDDLWHASVNGRGFFLSASNPNELVNSLLDIMQNIEEREGSASSVSVNGDELYTKLSGGGDILMFQSSYDTENWTGDVKAYQVCTQLTGHCAGKNIGDIIKSPYVWSANEKLGGLNWNTGRKIVTYNGADAGKPFRWGDLTTDQQTALNNDSTLLDYLRGDASNEVANLGSFRDRFARLGDMVHSSPTFENGVLYAGGNDGMLHAFAAADDEPYAGAVGGRELFAYVPNLVFDNLSQLADPNYTHKYFVDLTPTVKAGVDISGVSTTVLVGGVGKGGIGYYALDVTDPASWTSEGAIDDKVMWEYPNTSVPAVDIDDLGYSYSKPAIVKCNDPNVGWIVIFGNGYNSQNGHAVLFILDPSNDDIDGDGTQLLMKIDTGVDGCNGLSTPVPIDVNYDNKVDYVYVGDLRGNVWKFDLTDPVYTNWEVAFNDGANQPLFQAQGPGGTTQPITAKPDVMYHPTEHGYMVLFGTGQYLGESDISDTTAQSFYGIWDYGDDEDDEEYLGSFRRGYGQELSNQPSTVSLLAQQVIPSESPDPNEPDFWTVTLTDGAGNPYDLLLRLTTDHEIVWETMDDPDATQNPPEYLPDLSDSTDNHAGWYFDLPLSGERGTVDMMIRGGVIIAISFIPEDTPCGYGGDSVIHEMNAASGARLTRPQFDINGDGVIDDDDMINIGTALNPIWVVPSGMKKSGQLQPPAILIDPEGGVEIKYFSSSSGNIEKVYEKPPLLGISHWREFE